MFDRRRAARLLVVALVGVAVVGTSPTPPSPGPTQQVDLGGTIRLSEARPVAVQPIDVTLETGSLDTLTFAASLGQLPDAGTVVLSIEALDGEVPPRRTTIGPTPQPVLGAVTANATFSDPCARSCPAAYGLVLTWIGAPDAGTVDVAWALHVTARFMTTTGSGGPVRVSIAAPAAAHAPASTGLSSTASGKPVRLTESDRFRVWTVMLHRPAPTLPEATGRTFAQARLNATAIQVAGEPYRGENGKDRRETGRRDPPVQVRLAWVDGFDLRWAGEGPLTFDPFARCPAAGDCDQTLTIELAWADGRPDSTYDAAWTLDLAAVAVEGSVEPIDATVALGAVDDLAIATADGSFDAKGQIGRGRTEFLATGSVSLGLDSPWAAIGFPARGLVTARVSALAGTTLPPDASFQLFASAARTGGGIGLGTSAEIGVGEEVTLAFEPVLLCVPGQPRGCKLDGMIESTIGSPSPNAAPADLGYRVEWSLVLGAAVTDDGTFAIQVDPRGSPPP